MPKNFRTLIVASAIFAGMFFSASTDDRNDAVKPAVKAEKPNVVVSKKLTSSHFKSTPRLQKSDERPAAKVSTRKNQESDADHRFRKDMVLRINEIILKTQQNSPVLASELTDDLKLSLLKVFTAALGDGLEYVPALEFKKPRRNGANENGRSYFKSILIALGKVLYLRIDCFDEVALKGLRKDSANLAESATKPLGLIIDLRSASGTNYDLILKSLALFSGAESKLEKSKRATAFSKLPVIMLVDSETSGATEAFAAAMVKEGCGVCLGERTAGFPFEKKRMMLANGDFLQIPVVPEKFKKLARTSLKPDISFPARPQVPYEKLLKGGKEEESDKCVARAVDLLVCLNAISKSPKRN